MSQQKRRTAEQWEILLTCLIVVLHFGATSPLLMDLATGFLGDTWGAKCSGLAMSLGPLVAAYLLTLANQRQVWLHLLMFLLGGCLFALRYEKAGADLEAAAEEKYQLEQQKYEGLRRQRESEARQLEASNLGKKCGKIGEQAGDKNNWEARRAGRNAGCPAFDKKVYDIRTRVIPQPILKPAETKPREQFWTALRLWLMEFVFMEIGLISVITLTKLHLKRSNPQGPSRMSQPRPESAEYHPKSVDPQQNKDIHPLLMGVPIVSLPPKAQSGLNVRAGTWFNIPLGPSEERKSRKRGKGRAPLVPTLDQRSIEGLNRYKEPTVFVGSSRAEAILRRWKALPETERSRRVSQAKAEAQPGG